MSEESPEPPSDAIQKWLTAAEDLIKLISDNLRSGTWIRRLLFVDTVVVFFLNPGVVGKVLNVFFDLEKLPNWYTKYFWAAVGLIFVMALVVALLTPRQTKTDIVEFRERKAIKGLRPFTAEDAEIFAKLQRNRSLRECLEAITQDSFRFGILMGESGCGKTSFLQAGLVPKLSEPESKYHGIYIRFSDRLPFDAIREALVKDLKLTGTDLSTIGWLDLLTRSCEAANKPLILVFDQFEQFFVHYKTKDDRQPFVQALTEWYCSALPVRIFVSIRGDMSDRLVELQHAMQYSLSPQEVFRLEKFAPEEAAAILRVIAETEELRFDERFVKELSEQELARDGLISPVDLQILAWMIERQNSAELRAFDRTAFQKFGGMEGLLTRFLEKTLEARMGKSQREAAVKVLLALTDLEHNARTGVLTIAELEQKLQGTLPLNDITEAVSWLSRPEVRLITPIEQETTTGYELAHERLISAVRQVAGKELTQAQKANQLLDRRVNEWIGNNRSARYLFNWRELWLLRQQKPYLIWGSNRRDKERLISRSNRRVYRSVGIVLALLLIPFTGWRWLESPPGQRWQMRRELAEVSKNISSESSEAAAAIAFAKDGNEEQAFKIVDQIQDSYYKSSALSAIAEAYGKLNQTDKAIPLLEQALQVANSIEDSSSKSYALRAIAEAYSRLNQTDKAIPLLEQALQVANSITGSADSSVKSSALSAIAEAYGKLNQTDKAIPLLEQALKAANSIEDSYNKSAALRAVAIAYSRLNQTDKAIPLLEQALQIANSIERLSYKADALGIVAVAYDKLDQTDKAIPLLEQALQVANSIEDSSSKSSALRAIAEAYSRLNQTDKAIPLLEQALQVANSIEDSSSKSFALGIVADALGIVAEAIGKLNQTDKAIPLLEQVLQAANSIEVPSYSSSKSDALSAIAEAYDKLDQTDKAIPLLEQALQVANSIEDSYSKSSALSTITEAQARLGNWQQARQVVAQCNSNDCRANALSRVLTVWAEQQHPELKELREEEE